MKKLIRVRRSFRIVGIPSIALIMIIGGFVIGNAYAQHHFDVKTTWSLDSASTPNKDPQKEVVTTKNDTIEVNVGNVETYSYGGYIVRLEPKYEMKDKYLPVVIGECEATSIQRYKSGSVSSRPLTYEMFSNLLTAADVKVSKVIVTKLLDGTYYAIVRCTSKGKTMDVDSRPSDAINLALRNSTPVYVMRKVMEDAGELR